MNPIYQNYRNRPQSLETTLLLLRDLLNERLSPDCRKLWVQGTNVRGSLSFCFTAWWTTPRRLTSNSISSDYNIFFHDKTD